MIRRTPRSTLFPTRRSSDLPVVLVEAEACGKGEVGTHANEHPAPVSIVDVEVVLHDPALSQLQIPSVILLVPNGGQDACGFSRLEDDDHLVRLGMTKVGLDKVVASTLGSFQDGAGPSVGTIPHPVVELISDFPYPIPAHRAV